VGKDFINLLMMLSITRLSSCLYTLERPLSGYADKAGGATDYPDFDSSTDARQERKLLGAEAGVPVSGGKREGTQYDLTLVGRNS